MIKIENILENAKLEMPTNKLVIIEGYGNFIVISTIKYIILISCIILSIVMIRKKIKHEKINKIIIIVFTILLIITFFAFFTDIYDSLMRTILPYYYGV